jgi:hypothetical protein
LKTNVETAAKEMNYKKVEGCRLTVNLQAKTEVEVIGSQSQSVKEK